MYHTNINRLKYIFHFSIVLSIFSHNYCRKIVLMTVSVLFLKLLTHLSKISSYYYKNDEYIICIRKISTNYPILIIYALST